MEEMEKGESDEFEFGWRVTTLFPFLALCLTFPYYLSFRIVLETINYFRAFFNTMRSKREYGREREERDGRVEKGESDEIKFRWKQESTCFINNIIY